MLLNRMHTGKFIAAIFAMAMAHAGGAKGALRNAVPAKKPPPPKVQLSPLLGGTTVEALKARFARKGLTLLSWQATPMPTGGESHRLLYIKDLLLFTEVHKKPQRTNYFGESGQQVVFSRLRISEELQRAMREAIEHKDASVHECCGFVTGASAATVAALLGADLGEERTVDAPRRQGDAGDEQRVANVTPSTSAGNLVLVDPAALEGNDRSVSKLAAGSSNGRTQRNTESGLEPSAENTDKLQRKLAAEGMKLVSWQLKSQGNSQYHRLLYLRDKKLYTELHINPKRLAYFGNADVRVTLKRLYSSDDLRSSVVAAVREGKISDAEVLELIGRGTRSQIADALGLSYSVDSR